MNVISVQPSHAYGHGGALMVSIWRTQTTREAVREMHQLAVRIASGPQGIIMLTIVEANADLPDGDVRTDLAALFKAVSGSAQASALVFEGTGFKAAAVRSVTTGLNLMARQPFPHKILASVPEAADWLAENARGGMTARRILDETRSLRDALDVSERAAAP